MYSLSGITIPASVAYDEDFPTRNQENLAKAILDCLAAQKASSENNIYVDEDFYKGSYGFDPTTMTSFVAASNTITGQVEDSRGVIDNLMDLGSSVLPVQYRFLYYLAKPILIAIAEKFFHSLLSEEASVDLSGVEERLDTLNEKVEQVSNMPITIKLNQSGEIDEVQFDTAA
jgi:hypothetical protein